MVTDHGYAQGFGECCLCERCARVLRVVSCGSRDSCVCDACVCDPCTQGQGFFTSRQIGQRQVTLWGLLDGVTPNGLDRRLRKSGLVAESVEITCLCLEAYHAIYRTERLAVRYFRSPGPDGRQWQAMVLWIAERSGRSVTEGFIQGQLGFVASIMTGP